MVVGKRQHLLPPTSSRDPLHPLFDPPQLGCGVEDGAGSRAVGAGNLRPPQDARQAQTSNPPSFLPLLQIQFLYQVSFFYLEADASINKEVALGMETVAVHQTQMTK